jgi:hypothetical protein
MKFSTAVAITATFALLSWDANAGSLGAAAVVKADSQTYTDSTKTKPEYRLRAGTFVAFVGGMKWGQRKCKDGLCRITFFDENSKKGVERTSWIEEPMLEYFEYPCHEVRGGMFGEQTTCLPIEGAMTHQWSLPFIMAGKAKCKELGIAPPEGPVAITDAPATAPATAPPQP